MIRNDYLLSLLGRRIKTARKGLGASIQDAAEASGLSRRFWTELEAGRANISVARLNNVAVALEVELAFLLRPGPKVLSLLGLRGAGKSTVGKLLGERMGVAFRDVDHLVEGQAGMDLSDIFTLHGEQHFRQLEARVVRDSLSKDEPQILALSGGIVENDIVFERLLHETHTVWLKAHAKDHYTRAMRQGMEGIDEQPDRALASLEGLLNRRGGHYRKAQFVVDTHEQTPDQVADRIVEHFSTAMERRAKAV